jgi:hypothetical protein
LSQRSNFTIKTIFQGLIQGPEILFYRVGSGLGSQNFILQGWVRVRVPKFYFSGLGQGQGPEILFFRVGSGLDEKFQISNFKFGSGISKIVTTQLLKLLS